MDTSIDAGRLLRFESFELDVRSRELRKGKNLIRLQEQPFEILRMMLERPGDVVTREELAKRLWPDGTFVDFEHSLNAAVKRLRSALGDDADNPRFVETLPRRGYRFIAVMAANGLAMMPPVSPDYKARIAVLPFTNSSGEAGQEYFSEGLTEEMIMQLGRLGRGRIGVIARWSSMAFKGGTRRAREIGESLRADYLLEGSVRREGDRVRITAWLVETSSETHLWTDVYERHLTDCLSVQADVAARIAGSLAIELLPEQPLRPSRDVAAYQSYLKGRYYWNISGDEGLGQALHYFNQARESDPGFAAAFADVARTQTARAEYYNAEPRSLLEEAGVAAERALELDRHLSEAHLAHGNVRRMLHWDWEGAEASYRQALSLNPSSEAAHRYYAHLLVALGRGSEALTEVQRAVELDPLCLVVGSSAGWIRYTAGDYDGAIEECRNVIDMDQRFLTARCVHAAALLQRGQPAQAVEELESAAAIAPENPVVLAWLAHAKAVKGDCGVASVLLQALQRLAEHRYVPSYHVALVHAGLGQHDDVFALLEKACVERDPMLLNVGLDHRFAPLRGDARFTKLMEQLRLPTTG
jgi:TolB-like protein/Tfp pilus assembly protein PilF